LRRELLRGKWRFNLKVIIQNYTLEENDLNTTTAVYIAYYTSLIIIFNSSSLILERCQILIFLPTFTYSTDKKYLQWQQCSLRSTNTRYHIQSRREALSSRLVPTRPTGRNQGQPHSILLNLRLLWFLRLEIFLLWMTLRCDGSKVMKSILMKWEWYRSVISINHAMRLWKSAINY
jgi:hypothetical protein